jgi:hypothetical protein
MQVSRWSLVVSLGVTRSQLGIAKLNDLGAVQATNALGMVVGVKSVVLSNSYEVYRSLWHCTSRQMVARRLSMESSRLQLKITSFPKSSKIGEQGRFERPVTSRASYPQSVQVNEYRPTKTDREHASSTRALHNVSRTPG